MTADPFRRPPMVDLPIVAGESIYRRFSDAMDRLVENVEAYEPAEPWFFDWISRKMDQASTCSRCGCPPDRNCGCTQEACGCMSTQDTKETPMPATTGSTGGAGTPDVHDRRVGRWYDDKPITSTNTTPAGGSMPNIDEARGAIMAGIESLNEALGAIQSGHVALGDAQRGLLQATEGSNQAEADQAHAQVAESLIKVDEAQQQVASALQEFESVANRL